MSRRRPHRNSLPEISNLEDHCSDVPTKWLIKGINFIGRVRNHWISHSIHNVFDWYKNNVHIYLLPFYDYHMIKLLYNIIKRGYPDYI